MKRFVQIRDKTRVKDFDFLSWHKDEDSAGYILSFYVDSQKSPIQDDWFLELDELLTFAENEFGVDPEKWSY